MSTHISTRINIGIIAFGMLTAVLIAYLVPSLVEDLIRRDALKEAENNVDQIKALRKYYTENVVAPIQATEDVSPHYLHKNNDSHIPLPATVVHELSELYSNEGRTLDLYSKFPFPHRSGRVLDAFNVRAWNALSIDHSTAFSETVEINGRNVVRVAVADTMIADTCVDCHNSHPESPKRDWKLGDVRGVLEMQMDVTDDLALARQFGWMLAGLLAGISTVGSFGLSVFMRRSLLTPMENIALAAQHCADGNTSDSVAGVERQDEIGTLARSLDVFRKQADEVQRLHEERVEYLEKLEELVDERTKDLQTTTNNLTEKEGHLRMAMDYMPGAIFVVDRDMKITMANDQYTNFYEHSSGLVTAGTSMSDVLRHEIEHGLVHGKGTPEEILEERLASFQTEKSCVLEDRAADGRNLQLNRNPAPDGHVVTVITDVTERKTAERIVSEAMKLIHESIQYASRIQRSVLPGITELEDAFVDHMVIWEPKDVVGGDICLYRKCDTGHLIMLVDCTGHGVPGAFMTMIATGALDQALIEIPEGDPAALLGRINQLIKSVLGQDGIDGESDDGLECGLCLVDADAKRIIYAGACFELWCVDGDALTVMKGDKIGIGYRRTPQDFTFTNHAVPVTENSSYYMSSDGILDQIGGAKSRGFGKKRLKGLILDYSRMNLAKQAVHILRAFNEFQNNEERRDDVSLIGFKPRR